MLIARENITDPAPTDWSLWMPLADAATTLGMSATQAKRVAREQLRPSRLAMKTRPADGGKATWFIARTYVESRSNERRRQDAAFLRCDVLDATSTQRETAMARATLVRMLRRMREAGTDAATIVARLIEHAATQYPTINVCRSNLYKWDATLRESGDVKSLIDGRSASGRSSNVSPEAVEWFLRIYLHQNKPSIRDTFRRVRRDAAVNGWKWCGYANCKKQLPKWCPEAEQVRRRDPNLWRNKFRSTIDRDLSLMKPNDEWLGDHKLLDAVVRFADGRQGRVWVTSWMDHKTRKIVGYELCEKPNSSSILTSFRSAILDERNLGGPLTIVVDNGKDYRSRALVGEGRRRPRLTPEQRQTLEHRQQRREQKYACLFGFLDVSTRFTIPLEPTGKSPLERFHGTLGNLCKRFATWTGDSPKTRPTNHNALLRDPRNVPTFDVFKAELDRFVDDYNNDAENESKELLDRVTGERLSPSDAFARWATGTRSYSRETLDLLLLKPSGPHYVTRHGISMKIAGETCHFGKNHPALLPLIHVKRSEKDRVFAFYDPADASTIRVVRVDNGRFVCDARRDGRVGTGPQAERHIAEALAARRRRVRNERTMSRDVLIDTLRPADAADVIADNERRREQAERQRRAVADLPMRITPTFVDEPAATPRPQLRKAVGAELLSSDDADAFDPIAEMLAAERDDRERGRR